MEKTTAISAVAEVEEIVILAVATILRPRTKVKAKSISETWEKAQRRRAQTSQLLLKMLVKASSGVRS